MFEFSSFANDLTKQLHGNTASVSYEEVQNEPTYIEALKSIKETPKKRRDRTDEKIDQDVVIGKAIEIGISKILKGSYIWNQTWDVKDPHSYGKDIITAEGIRLETKHTRFDRLFNISPGGHQTLTNCIKEDTMDAIVVANTIYNPGSDSIIIKPHLLIEPTSVLHLMELKSSMDGNDFYSYRVGYAHDRGRCRYINFEES